MIDTLKRKKYIYYQFFDNYFVFLHTNIDNFQSIDLQLDK